MAPLSYQREAHYLPRSMVSPLNLHGGTWLISPVRKGQMRVLDGWPVVGLDDPEPEAFVAEARGGAEHVYHRFQRRPDVIKVAPGQRGPADADGEAHGAPGEACGSPSRYFQDLMLE